jgi:transposase-like protein
MQCPQCRRSFQTNNSTKKYCTADCQQRYKAETRAARVSQRDFRPAWQEQHRRNSGADASRRAAQGAPSVDWLAVIARFKASTAAMYEGTDE